jgi:hypothetical protein
MGSGIYAQCHAANNGKAMAGQTVCHLPRDILAILRSRSRPNNPDTLAVEHFRYSQHIQYYGRVMDMLQEVGIEGIVTGNERNPFFGCLRELLLYPCVKDLSSLSA